MVKVPSIVKAKADIQNNCLHVVISGNANKKQLDRLYTEIRFCVADLKPGFEVISDISECSLIYIDSLTIYKKIMDYLVSQKIGGIVRITHDQNISTKQMRAFTEAISCYNAIEAHSASEAKEKMACMKRRDGIRFHLHQVPVFYESPEAHGQGTIIDLSISGCSVASRIPLALDQGNFLFLSINFNNDSEREVAFKAKAKVVRSCLSINEQF